MVCVHGSPPEDHLRDTIEGLQFKLQEPILDGPELRQVMPACPVDQGVLVNPTHARGIWSQFRVHARRQARQHVLLREFPTAEEAHRDARAGGGVRFPAHHRVEDGRTGILDGPDGGVAARGLLPAEGRQRVVYGRLDDDVLPPVTDEDDLPILEDLLRPAKKMDTSDPKKKMKKSI